jgi:hypothetical protein
MRKGDYDYLLLLVEMKEFLIIFIVYLIQEVR